MATVENAEHAAPLREPFADYWRRDRSALVAYAWSLCGEHAIAEEIVADTAARAYPRWASIRTLAPEHLEVWAAVRALPTRQAQVVALYYLEDRTVADIGEILDLAAGTVKATLHHARRALGATLGLDPEAPASEPPDSEPPDSGGAT